MRSFLLLLSLTALLITPLAFAEEPEGPDAEMQHDFELEITHAEQQNQLRHIQMEMQQEEAEMEFGQQMRQLQLEERRSELERNNQRDRHHKDDGCIVVLLILCIVVHILTATWVYKDIDNRKTGSGIWIAIPLIAGLPGALVYAVVRLGDKPPTKSKQ